MARYRAQYDGERRTEKVTVQLAPSERHLIEQEAKRAGAALSEYVRELCLRRRPSGPVVAGTTRNPDARALVKELVAIGNNLNQLARISNTEQAAPQLDELTRTTELLKTALSHVIGA